MGDAWATFAGVDTENCFDVWRAVVLATTQKFQAEVIRPKSQSSCQTA